MWRHTLGLLVMLALGLWEPPGTAVAQQAPRVYRIGWLSAGRLRRHPRSKCRPSRRGSATWAMSKGTTS